MVYPLPMEYSVQSVGQKWRERGNSGSSNQEHGGASVEWVKKKIYI